MDKITPYKNRTLDIEKRVQVYRNLTRKTHTYSIKQNGKVVGHADELSLKFCNFIVNERGRQWVIRHKRKTVHAYADGYIMNKKPAMTAKRKTHPNKIMYDPYQFDSFMCLDLSFMPGIMYKISSAKYAIFNKYEVKGIEVA